MISIRRLSLLLGLCVLLPALSVCGGDDGDGAGGDDLESYFGELSARAALNNLQIDLLEQKYPTAFEEVEPTKQYYEEYVTIYDRFVEQARDLVPPSEVADEHEQYLTTSEALQSIAQTRLQELRQAETRDEIDAILAPTDEFAEAVAKQDFACSELKRIAEGEGYTVPGLRDCDNTN